MDSRSCLERYVREGGSKSDKTTATCMRRLKIESKYMEIPRVLYPDFKMADFTAKRPICRRKVTRSNITLAENQRSFD